MKYSNKPKRIHRPRSYSHPSNLHSSEHTAARPSESKYRLSSKVVNGVVQNYINGRAE